MLTTEASEPGAPHRRTATAAGVYDWFLGGHHHLDCDAEAAIATQNSFPLVARTARYNRGFLQRAVAVLVTLGVRQFLDIGSGYPTVGNVHEIAQDRASDSRVVYVDHDEDTVEVSRRILAGNATAACIRADVREPEDLLRHREVVSLLDFSRPVGLLLISVLPFVDNAAPVVRRYVDRLAPGSYLAITHVTMPPDERVQRRQATSQQHYNHSVKEKAQVRTREEIACLFAGTDMVPPGLVQATAWMPRRPSQVDENDEASIVLLGGVGRRG